MTSFVFHAGTKKIDENWTSTGGRILLAGSLGDTLEEAAAQALAAVANLKTDDTFYRKDIGHRALKHRAK